MENCFSLFLLSFHKFCNVHKNRKRIRKVRLNISASEGLNPWINTIFVVIIKDFFRAKPIGRRNQGRPKSRWADGVNSDSLALGVRDWTHCAQDRQSWKDLLGQA
jgi:hypothetical protein